MVNARDICEALFAGKWRVLTVGEVLALGNQPTLRCVECNGRVRAHNEANNGMRAHFEHRVAHPGCSLGSKFNGKKTPHPDAATE